MIMELAQNFFKLIRELMGIVQELWLEFVNAGEEKWYAVIFKLDLEYKFKIKYSYEIDRNVGYFEREIYWAYEQLNIVPEDSFEKRY